MNTIRETIPDALDGERLDRVVTMFTGCSRAEASELIEQTSVRIDGTPATTRSTRLHSGQVVEVDYEAPTGPAPIEPDPTVEIDVVFADDHVIVVDKPAGLVVHPGAGNPDQTLVNGVVARWPEVSEVGDPQRPGVVHRIDQGTSGLLVLARTSDAYDSLVAQFSARSVEREYLALAWGHVEPAVGMIDAPIGRSHRDPTRMAVTNTGREARTRYEVLATFTDPASVCSLSCRLETGRTHQIRVHLAAIGHPLVGDGRYGGDRSPLPCARPWLHAARLGFEHPGTGEHVNFHSELPEDLVVVRDRLR
jgi:23S rRNA pseudouridine1911/1915/1917 synthase